MIRLLLFIILLMLCGCGVGRIDVASTTDPISKQAQDLSAQLQVERERKTNEELKKKIAENNGIIAALSKDNAENQKQILKNDEAHWATIAYLVAGILSLAVLVLGFLAFESPIARTKFVTGAVFCGLAAVCCVWVGREIHLLLMIAPWALVVGAGLGIWGAIDHSRVRTFFTGMWIKTSTELQAHAPEVANQLDRASFALQGKSSALYTKLLSRVRAKKEQLSETIKAGT